VSEVNRAVHAKALSPLLTCCLSNS
jgi:hypothetical protein